MSQAEQGYVMGEFLGSRGMVDLYQGRDQSSNQPITFQLLGKSAAADPLAQARFDREFRAARAVSSPYVCRYLEVVEVAGGKAIVTEAQEGRDLRALLAMEERLSVADTVAITLQLARGLAACHRAGVVHRDLNPDNVLISDDGRVRLVHFGMSQLEHATALTTTGLLMASPDYAAPEAFVGGSLDPRADIYALGVILWEMLIGFNPFTGMGIGEIMRRKSSGVGLSPAEIDAELPLWLDQLCRQLTDPDPRNRPASLAPVIESLEQQGSVVVGTESRTGACLSCGYPRSEQLPFCGFCGADPGEKTPEAYQTVILHTTAEPARFAQFLQRIMPPLPSHLFQRKLKQRPLALGFDFSRAEAAWLVDQAGRNGAVAERLDTSRFAFKINSLILVLILAWILVLLQFPGLIHTLYTAPLYEDTTFTRTNAIWGLIASLAILARISVTLAWYAHRHFMGLKHIAAQWWAGLMGPGEGRDQWVHALGALLPLGLLATVFLMILSAFLSRMAVLPENLYHHGHRFAAEIFFIGFLLVVSRRVTGPPLPTLLYTTARSKTDGHQYLAVFQRMKEVLANTHLEEYRHILAKMVPCYLQIRRLFEEDALGAGDGPTRLVTEAELAFEKIMLAGERLEREFACAQQAKALPDQEELAAFHERNLREQLNGLRLVLGGLQTVFLRLQRFQQDPALDEDLRDTLKLLQHELSALSFLDEPMPGGGR